MSSGTRVTSPLQSVRLSSTTTATEQPLPSLGISPESTASTKSPDSVRRAHMFDQSPDATRMVDLSPPSAPRPERPGRDDSRSDDALVLQGLVDELAALRRENEQLLQTNDSLQGDHAKLVAHHSVMTTTIDEISEELTQERDAHARTAAALKDERNMRCEAETRLQDTVAHDALVTGENATLAEAVGEARDVHKATADKLFLAEEQLCAAAARAADLESQLSSITAKHAAAEQRADSLAMELAEAAADARTTAQRVQRLEASCAAVKSHDAENAADLREAEEKLQRQTEEVRRKMQRIQGLERDLAASKLDATKATERAAKAERRIADVQSALDDICEHACRLADRRPEGQSANVKAQLKLVATCIGAAAARIDELKADATTAVSKLKDMKAGKKQHDSELREARTAADELTQQMLETERRCATQQERADLLEKRHRHMEDAHDALQDALRRVERERDDALELVSTEEFRRVELEAQLAAEADRGKTARRESDTASSAHNAAKAEVQALTQRVTELQLKIDALHTERAELREQSEKKVRRASRLSEDVKRLTAELDEAKRGNGVLSSKLRTAEEHLAHKQHKLHVMRERQRAHDTDGDDTGRRVAQPARQPDSARDARSNYAALADVVAAFVRQHAQPSDEQLPATSSDPAAFTRAAQNAFAGVSAYVMQLHRSSCTALQDLSLEKDRVQFMQEELNVLRLMEAERMAAAGNDDGLQQLNADGPVASPRPAAPSLAGRASSTNSASGRKTQPQAIIARSASPKRLFDSARKPQRQAASPAPTRPTMVF